MARTRSKRQNRGGVFTINLMTIVGLFALGIFLVYYFYPETFSEWFGYSTPATPTPSASQPPKEPSMPNPSNESVAYASISTKGALVKHGHFILSYNEAYENAEWVGYELTKNSLLKPNEPRSGNFRADPSVVTGTAESEDYRGGGFDRGHLCPAGDRAYSPEAMSETFLMSNISPQLPGFNRGIWKELEEQVRRWAVKFGGLTVVTGPVLNVKVRKKIGKKNKVAVPLYFYKVLLHRDKKFPKGIAFVVPNEDSDKSLREFACSIADVERLTGLNFFPNFDEKESHFLESAYSLQRWGLDPGLEAQRIQEASLRMNGLAKLTPE